MEFLSDIPDVAVPKALLEPFNDPPAVFHLSQQLDLSICKVQRLGRGRHLINVEARPSQQSRDGHRLHAV